MWDTYVKLNPLTYRGLMSSTSCRLRSHKTISLMPARLAKISHGSSDRKDLTAKRDFTTHGEVRTLRWVNALAKAVSIVTPALGPSLGMAPCGVDVHVPFVGIGCQPAVCALRCCRALF